MASISRSFPTFSEVSPAPVDPMFLLKQEYDNDLSPTKVDLGAGVLRDEKGACHEFTIIKEAKAELERRKLTHDYRPTTGIPSYRRNAARFLFGEDNAAFKENRIASVQTVAGTGACRIGAVFLNKHWPSTSSHETMPVYVGTPTWGNYDPLFRHAGFAGNVITYPYLNRAQNVDMGSTVATLKGAPDKSVFVFQGCCHNPTGRDYSQSQWAEIADMMKAKGHFAFFDTAYQGLGNGEVEDAWAVRHFAAEKIDMLVCQSFSKNAGLYSERVGALHIVCPTAGIATNVVDQLRSLIRWEVSSAPAFGAELVNIILSDPSMKRRWQSELYVARERMRELRKSLHRELAGRCATPSPRTGNVGGWDHLLKENGLFSFTGLSPANARALIEKYHVYLPDNGRINVSGLNAGSINQVAEAFDNVIRSNE